jgi:hypothetical protein
MRIETIKNTNGIYKESLTPPFLSRNPPGIDTIKINPNVTIVGK